MTGPEKGCDAERTRKLMALLDVQRSVLAKRHNRNGEIVRVFTEQFGGEAARMARRLTPSK